MPPLRSSVFIDELEQYLFFYLIPKNNKDKLILNMPYLIHERFAKWIDEKEICRLLLMAGKQKYTFVDAKVNKCRVMNNRYGQKCHDLEVSYASMLYGFRLSGVSS